MKKKYHRVADMTYIHNNPVCVRVYVCKTLEAGSEVVLSIRQCRPLLNKYESTRELDSWIGTHTHRVIVYLGSPTNSMTTYRPASVLLLICDVHGINTIKIT